LPTQGRVDWPGFAEIPAKRPGTVGFVFQAPSLINVLDVGENVALPLVLAGAEARDVELIVDAALADVDLAGMGRRLPSELSGGQAQRVAVARVLAQRPQLILADEPTAQLDAAHGQQVMEALISVARSIGAALVVATHDLLIADLLPMRWTLADGRLTNKTGVLA
jgi:putative ABC transport system ATP-binding protein